MDKQKKNKKKQRKQKNKITWKSRNSYRTQRAEENRPSEKKNHIHIWTYNRRPIIAYHPYEPFIIPVYIYSSSHSFIGNSERTETQGKKVVFKYFVERSSRQQYFVPVYTRKMLYRAFAKQKRAPRAWRAWHTGIETMREESLMKEEFLGASSDKVHELTRNTLLYPPTRWKRTMSTSVFFLSVFVINVLSYTVFFFL